MKPISKLMIALTAIGLGSSQGVVAGMELGAEVGLGYDSNIYQSPSESYVDLSQASTPVVNPTEQSGAFIPIDGYISYEHVLSEAAAMKAGYKLGATRFLDRQYSNADETKHRVDLGGEYILNQVKSRKDSVYVGVFMKSVDEYYVDRDNGGDKLAGAANVADRYNYDSRGLELEYKNRTSNIQYGVSYLYEVLDYVDPVVISQYDNDYTKLSADVEFRLAKSTKLSFDLSLANRAYDERPSRNLNGSLPASNPAREYDYQSLETTIRQKLSDSLVAYISYEYSIRDDLYVGYNDYSAHTFKARLLQKTASFRNRLAVKYKKIDYANAYAYEEPTAGLKTYDALEFSVSTEMPQSDNSAIWAELNYNAVDTNDSRYKYDKFMVATGYKWTY